jgi:hypothetical protein
MARARIIAAGQYWRELRDIPLSWRSPALTSEPNSNQIVVRGAIDTSGVAFDLVKGAQTAALDVAMFALNGRGDVIGEAWQPVELKFDSGQMASARASGIPCAATITAKPDDVREIPPNPSEPFRTFPNPPSLSEPSEPFRTPPNLSEPSEPISSHIS